MNASRKRLETLLGTQWKQERKQPADPVSESMARRGRARREVEAIEAEKLRKRMDMVDET